MFKTAHFVLLLGLWGQQGSKKISDREAVEERAEKKTSSNQRFDEVTPGNKTPGKIGGISLCTSGRGQICNNLALSVKERKE